MRVSAKTDIGRGRSENQDHYRSGVLPSGYAWGLVCDGMGGGYDGKLAGNLAANCIEDEVYTGLDKPTADVKVLLTQAILKANTEVFEKAGQEGQIMGTTVVCAVLQGQKLCLAHVGDSRAYLYQNGVLQPLTRDHSMVQEMVEQGLISKEEAVHHPEKNVITRAVGVEETVEVEYSEHTAQLGALLLLCTDGLTNMVPDETIAGLMQQTDFYDLAGALVGAALVVGGNDNITVLLMQVEEDEADAG
ncbi:MAG: Stp1/IreP family PP2C-type Ser/Thr phosphatase [Oscillospiraceae bacterium]